MASGCIRQLLVQRLAVVNAAANELRPVGHNGQRVGFFRQQRPQRGVVPAQLVARAVAMRANALAELFDFNNELLT
jgi:hypothetical protein